MSPMKTTIVCLLLMAGLLGTAPLTRAKDSQGFLYGRVTLTDGSVHQGRLRFGEAEEAFWGHYFNSRKTSNAWAELVDPEKLVQLRPVRVFGIELGHSNQAINLERPLMIRHLLNRKRH